MKKIAINLKSQSYDILINKGLLLDVNKYLNSDFRYLIISDDNVPSIYVDTLKNELKNSDVFIFKHGEENKNLTTYSDIISFMIEKHYSRNDYLIALGGGVVSDLVSFVASTYKRGIKFINIPTTTLAMVDASIGGKAGIDFNGIKNMIGSFYQPSLVLIDTDLLKTLDKRNYNNGLVETLKCALIGDKDLYDIFAKNDIESIEEIIYRSLLVKKRFVEADEKEENVRKILNFGHTFGHAFESYYNFKYLHGECVAFGLLTIAKNESYYESLERIINSLDIHFSFDYDPNKVLSYIYNDKKTCEEMVDLIVVKEIGTAKIIRENISSLERYL